MGKTTHNSVTLELDAPSDVSLYCVVRWLSTSNVLSRFVDLLKPIILFLDEKRKCYPQLKNNAWIQDLMFLADIMKQLQILSLALQGTEKTISDLAQSVFSFQKNPRDGVVVRASASQSVDLGFIPLVESYRKILKNGSLSIASLLGARHLWEVVENKPASSLVVSLDKALNETPHLYVEDR